MMTLFTLFSSIMFYYFLFSSTHLLIIMIMIEFMVLFTFFVMLSFKSNPLTPLFFMLIAVCMGAYSLCLFIYSSRSKLSSYSMSSFLI